MDLALADQTDLQKRYRPQPPCPEGCRECDRGHAEKVVANENLEWSRISCNMKKPKWVFDGRGLVDVEGMENLGFRVEVIGKAGSRSWLHGEQYPLSTTADL